MRSAIVGCGAIAQVHARCIQKMNPNGLAAAADCDEINAVSLCHTFGGTAYSSLEEMLDHEQIDVLHICTPHYLHTPMASEALSRGIHVLMEKPPVINREQWQELKNARRLTPSRIKLGFCFQNRYNPTTRRMKELLEQKSYGKVLGMRGMVFWNRLPSYYQNSPWRGRLDREGGGVLINQSIHTLDLIQFLMNKAPLSIDAVSANHHLKEIMDEEDTMSALIDYADASASFYATSGYTANVPPIIEAECEKARIRIEDRMISIIHPNGEVTCESLSFPDCPGKDYWGSGHAACIQDFYRCAANNQPFCIELKDIEDTVHLLLGAYTSARNHSPVLIRNSCSQDTAF